MVARSAAVRGLTSAAAALTLGIGLMLASGVANAAPTDAPTATAASLQAQARSFILSQDDVVTHRPLAGARFTLRTDQPARLVNDAGNPVTVVTTDTGGSTPVVRVVGLDDLTITATETAAPTGYSLPTQPVTLRLAEGTWVPVTETAQTSWRFIASNASPVDSQVAQPLVHATAVPRSGTITGAPIRPAGGLAALLAALRLAWTHRRHIGGHR